MRKQLRLSAFRHGGASALALAFAASSHAVSAQETADGAEQAGDGQLDTIIVTANRREENLQDVAVSAATLGDDRVQTIFSAGADTTALAAQVPGLFVESSNGRAAPRFYIRGLGNTDFDLAASQPVSVVMDEVVMENVVLKSFPIFDAQRIEVFRGPQGTLFGRNTPAGIVKIDTEKPTQYWDANGSVSFGSYGTLAIDAGVGGPLVEDTVAFRLSGLLQRRDDWVDNGFTGEDEALGGFRDMAFRGQILLTPGDAFSALASVQYRDLEGTSTLFRANILGPGNNELNANYDRDTVFFDAGGGNQAQYEQLGATLKLDYDFGGATLTSITSHQEAEGSSRGDIDGGNLITGPGFIPFPADTEDSIDLQQFTQEVRLASNGGGAVEWQVGAFYFDSDFDVTTEGFTFPPETIVNHTNESWAIFGQVSAQVTDMLKLTGGLRYTDDEKDFVVLQGVPATASVQDDRLSWDIAAFADVSDDFSIYGRVASGFRAPTIQGRDVAFFQPPSIAQSETIMSYEAGFKSELADRTVRLNGAVFHYVVDDPQFTAVGGGGNLVQLINANKGVAYGFELDSAFQLSENFLVTAGVSYNDTEIQDGNLAVGICAQCTVLDPIVNINGNDRALVDGNPFPNAPEWIGDVTARLGIPVSDEGEFFIFTDWTFQGETNFLLYESAEFVTGSQIEGGLRAGYAALDGSYEIALFVRNITDEDNVKGGIDFNNNTAFVNDPRIIGLSARFDY